MLYFPPGKEATYTRQVVRQAVSIPLGKEAVLPRQLLIFPMAKAAILPWQLLTFLPVKEAILPQQLLTFLLIKILKRVKNQTGLDSNTYKSMYPTGFVPPKFYGLPKIHKPDTPLRPIVSNCGSVTYGVAKELAKILKPLVGKSPHHITSTQDFVEQAREIKLEPGECLSSYDVSALFTSVPIDPALNIIKDLLDKDTTLKERTVMEVGDIILLLEFCLKNTYFSFQDQFYEQVEGAAMSSSVSPIVANLYMEYLEQKALSTAPHPPVSGTGMWMTPLSSTRKPINKASFNTSTVLTLP